MRVARSRYSPTQRPTGRQSRSPGGKTRGGLRSQCRISHLPFCLLSHRLLFEDQGQCRSPSYRDLIGTLGPKVFCVTPRGRPVPPRDPTRGRTPASKYPRTRFAGGPPYVLDKLPSHDPALRGGRSACRRRIPPVPHRSALAAESRCSPRGRAGSPDRGLSDRLSPGRRGAVRRVWSSHHRRGSDALCRRRTRGHAGPPDDNLEYHRGVHLAARQSTPAKRSHSDRRGQRHGGAVGVSDDVAPPRRREPGLRQ